MIFMAYYLFDANPPLLPEIGVGTCGGMIHARGLRGSSTIEQFTRKWGIWRFKIIPIGVARRWGHQIMNHQRRGYSYVSINVLNCQKGPSEELNIILSFMWLIQWLGIGYLARVTRHLCTSHNIPYIHLFHNNTKSLG